MGDGVSLNVVRFSGDCRSRKVLVGHELDGSPDTKEVVVASEGCREETGGWTSPVRYISQFEILFLDPSNGSEVDRRVVKLPKKMSLKITTSGEAGLAGRTVYSVDPNAVEIYDFDDDGDQDLILIVGDIPERSTSASGLATRIVNEGIVIYVNDGEANFEPLQ